MPTEISNNYYHLQNENCQLGSTFVAKFNLKVCDAQREQSAHILHSYSKYIRHLAHILHSYSIYITQSAYIVHSYSKHISQSAYKLHSNSTYITQSAYILHSCSTHLTLPSHILPNYKNRHCTFSTHTFLAHISLTLHNAESVYIL